jgi:hypothetical protein
VSNHKKNCLGSRRTTIIIHSRRRGVVRKAIIVKVNLSATLLQNADNIVERAETIFVSFTAGVGLVNWDDGVIAKAYY